MSDNYTTIARGTSTGSLMGEVRQLDYSTIETQTKFLQGKVLTVIEASCVNEGQQKAVKDLIKKMFSEQLSHIASLCYPEVHMMTREAVNEIVGDVEKIEREAETLTEKELSG